MKKKEEKLSKFDRPPLKTPKPPIRTGSMDFMKYPTRIANTLFYMDENGSYKDSKKDN